MSLPVDCTYSARPRGMTAIAQSEHLDFFASPESFLIETMQPGEACRRQLNSQAIGKREDAT